MHFSLKNQKFVASDEGKYRAHYLKTDTIQSRVGIALFMLPMLLFVFKDYQFFGWSILFYRLVILRFCALLCSGLLINKLGRVKDYKEYDTYLFIAGLLAIVTISLLNLSRPPDYYIFVAVDMAIMAVIYTIIPTKLVNQLILGVLFTISDTCILVFTRSQSVRPLLVTIIPGFLLVNSVGVASSWLLQTFRRGQYSAQVKEQDALSSAATLAAQLEEAQAVANVGNWTYCPQTDETTWSDEMYRIYGIRRTENKRYLSELATSMKAESWDRLKAAVAGTLATGIPYELELEIVRPDGSKRFVLSRGQLKQTADDCTPQLFGTTQDITELKRKEQIISASLREKEMLLKEVQHRVKNNMQVVSSLLRMQSQYVKHEDDARMFQESQDRIYSMSMVYDQLCHSEDLAQINLRSYVNELAVNLIHSYSPASGYVSAHIEVDDICVGLDLAIPCGLLINEVVTNSMKYAFPHKIGGNISISIHEKGDMLDLTVADDGVGLPADIDATSGATLGMTLLRTLSEQLGGKEEFRRDGGTVFHINFNMSQPD